FSSGSPPVEATEALAPFHCQCTVVPGVLVVRVAGENPPPMTRTVGTISGMQGGGRIAGWGDRAGAATAAGTAMSPIAIAAATRRPDVRVRNIRLTVGGDLRIVQRHANGPRPEARAVRGAASLDDARGAAGQVGCDPLEDAGQRGRVRHVVEVRRVGRHVLDGLLGAGIGV